MIYGRFRLFLLVVTIISFFISIGVLIKFSVNSLDSIIIVFLFFEVQILPVSVGFGTAPVVGLIFLEVIIAESFKELQPIGEMVAIALSDGLP